MSDPPSLTYRESPLGLKYGERHCFQGLTLLKTLGGGHLNPSCDRDVPFARKIGTHNFVNFGGFQGHNSANRINI